MFVATTTDASSFTALLFHNVACLLPLETFAFEFSSCPFANLVLLLLHVSFFDLHIQSLRRWEDDSIWMKYFDENASSSVVEVQGVHILKEKNDKK